jgi:hypothetical protein
MLRHAFTPTDQERVADAAAALDELYPGWAEWIDLDSLNMLSWTFCVGAQIACHVEDSLVHQQMGWQLVADQVYAELGYSDDDERNLFSGFEDFWIAEIVSRRNSG